MLVCGRLPTGCERGLSFDRFSGHDSKGERKNGKVGQVACLKAQRNKGASCVLRSCE